MTPLGTVTHVWVVPDDVPYLTFALQCPKTRKPKTATDGLPEVGVRDDLDPVVTESPSNTEQNWLILTRAT